MRISMEDSLHVEFLPKEGDYLTRCNSGDVCYNELDYEMSDSSLGRSGSEDDIIEDYDVVLFKAQCIRNRTTLEKVLLGFALIAIVIVFGLAIALASSGESGDPKSDACRTEQCVKVSFSIHSTMDPEVNPCDNFYQYACGGWLRETPIPNGYLSWDRFQEVSNKNYYILKTQLESKPLYGEAEIKARRFYNSCVNNKRAHQRSTIQQLINITKSVDGWPLTHDDGSILPWNFQSMLEKIHRLDSWPLFQVKVEVDETSANRYSIKIDVGQLGMRPEYFPPRVVKKVETNSTNETDSEPEKLQRNITELRMKYMDDTTRILKVLGEDTANAKKIAEETYEFESSIADLMTQDETKRSVKPINKATQIKTLDATYPSIQWLEYFKAVAKGKGQTITSENTVFVYNRDYLSGINDVIAKIQSNSTHTHVLRNFMTLTLVRSLEKYFDDGLFEEPTNFEDIPQGHWRRCVFYTNQAMGLATGAIYVNDTSHEASVEKIENMISYIKRAFTEHLLVKFWIDTATRNIAATKIDAIIEKISYPSYILNITFLDIYYSKLEVNEGKWFENILNWKEFELDRMFSKLKEEVDRRSWISPPVTTNAFYSEKRNDLLFPIAMFHLPFYVPDGPMSFNFGAMGSVIGHEITHAFDIKGRYYDKQGRYSNWWADETAKKFEVATDCVREQYSKLEVDGLKVNGLDTLDENIADNGGLRAANIAYRLWLKDHEEERPLPGLNGLDVNHYQLFFVSFAQMYCSKYYELGLLEHLLHDKHSPGEARVNGVVSNSRSFNREFNCPYISRHNPSVKCIVW